MNASVAVLMQPGRIGPLETPNRIVRAGTSETMAGRDGEVTPELIELYRDLAEGGAGVIFTGHMYCHPRGRYSRRQTGIDDDRLIDGLSRLTDAVHGAGGRILGQVAHAGSQSRVAGNNPLAPSAVPNALTGRNVDEAKPGEVDEAIEAFAAGARRAVAAGFDGVHIHGANGYLISEFGSPRANRRTDEWGGSPEARDRFPLAVVRAVRAEVPAHMPLTMKLGVVDTVQGGLQLGESLARVKRLVDGGLDAVEISCGVMGLATESADRYVAVDARRALEDWLLHRIHKRARDEAYFRSLAVEVRKAVDTTIVLVGGLRRTETMADVLSRGDADFVSLARPLIREPDLPAQIAAGRTGQVDCTSCNLCLIHEGHHSLRCWRTPRRRLLEHSVYRLRGGLRRDAQDPPSSTS
jgi:2,4-dienoyl-CoA reductase-like NADH-dependent reductase (Old Yellow Enzyme family)